MLLSWRKSEKAPQEGAHTQGGGGFEHPADWLFNVLQEGSSARASEGTDLSQRESEEQSESRKTPGD